MKQQCMIVVTLCGWLACVPVAAHQDSSAAKAANAAKEQKPWGIAGDKRSVTRTIAIEMRDSMRFAPAHIRVKQGDTVKFVVRNAGKVLHEMVIGTKQSLAEHAALMRKFPNMEHDEPDMAHVAPGKTGRLVWHFNRAGEFDFACLIPGHYEAGMTGTLTVEPSRKAIR